MAKKINYPKSIYRRKDRDGYYIQIFSKKDKKLYNVGYSKTIEDAVKKRDRWLVENYNLVEGYLPRGITYSENKFISKISIADLSYHIGQFDTLQEAIDYRTKFILGLL